MTVPDVVAMGDDDARLGASMLESDNFMEERNWLSIDRATTGWRVPTRRCTVEDG